MALGTGHLSNTSGSVDDFIPELWSDDVIAAYKPNLVLGNLVSKFNHRGKRGDTIHIPVPTRGAANAKTVGSQVTINDPGGSEKLVVIDKWYEYSIMVEDIIAIQSLPSMRQFYTNDAGLQLARQVDFDLHVLGTFFQGGTLDTSVGTLSAPTLAYDTAVIGGDGTTAWSAIANTNTGNGSSLTDAAVRRMIRTLDDTDTPMGDRAFVIPPIEKESLLGIARFTEQAFTGEAGGSNSIRTGMIGNLYGIPVFVSTSCPVVKAADGVTEYRACMLVHKDALVFAEQSGIRSQTQYKQEYLGSLYTSDTIYGTAGLRDYAGVAFIVPNT